jgi:hypothetical protein
VVFVAVWCVLEDFDTGHVVPLVLLIPAAVGSRDGIAHLEERS